MKTSFNLNKEQFYVVRANRAGVFICKPISFDGSTIKCNSFRRLYYWNGALDVSMIAKEGVASSGNKFSIQTREEDICIITEVIEIHSLSEKALKTINSVSAWNKN